MLLPKILQIVVSHTKYDRPLIQKHLSYSRLFGYDVQTLMKYHIAGVIA